MRLTRRAFIQASCATAAMVVAGCATQGATPVTSAMAVRKARPAGPAKGDWVASTCQGCTQWCAIQIFVEEGRAVRVRGNPLSKTNHGYVCPRGHLIPQQVYDPDRIKVPMKRTNPAKGRGVDPKFVPITWDEALDTIAGRMMELRRNNEAHKLVYIRGRYSPTSTELLYGALPKIYGTTNYFSHSAICAEAEKMGPGLTQGFFGYRDYDLEKTNCLVIWGCDPLASNRMVPNTIYRFHEIAARGMVITVDPRLSNAAAKSQEWVPVKPGTDGALAGAFAHVLLTEGLWNREFVGDFKDGKNLFVAGQTVDETAFVEKETFGLVKWWNLELKDRTPAWGEKETLIPAAQIVRVARAMGKAAPKTAVWMGPGVAMNPRGTYAAMAVHALNGLLGSIDVEGGVWQSSSVPIAAFPKSDAYLDDIAKGAGKFKKLDGRGAKDMPAMMNAIPGSGVVTNNIANGMLKDPGAAKVVICSWANFNFSCTGAERWDKALAAVPFFVHLVTNPSEMTQFADIVLPSTFNSAEGWSIVTNMGNGFGYASIQQGAVKRLWDVKQEETEVVWLLAEKLKAKGFPNLFDYYSKEFKDPETGKAPTTALEFSEIADQDDERHAVEPQGAAEGRRQVDGLGRVPQEGHLQRREVHAQEGLGRQVRDRDQEVRVLQRDGEEGPARAREEVRDHGGRHHDRQRLRRARRGRVRPALRAAQAPRQLRGIPVHVRRLQVPPEPRGPVGQPHLVPGIQEGRPGRRVVGRRAEDESGRRRQAGAEDRRHGEGHVAGGRHGHQAQAVGGRAPRHRREVLRPGALGLRPRRGEGLRKAKPRGGSNNDVLVDDYDRLSGSTARNGGFTGVRIQKA